MDQFETKDRTSQIRAKIAYFPQYTFYKCNRPDIKVACILDTFSYECFKYEAQFQQLRLQTWRQQISAMQPHFLFVESAWRGIDDTWRNVLTNKANVSKQELLELIAYCKNNKIPTLFWNKEDPVNYAIFIYAAKLFDFIFTTDEDCVPMYIRDAGHNRVYVLPFAAQPAIHNPVNSSYLTKENVAFAGTWYVVKHLERQDDMRLLLTPAKEFGLDIFDRMYTFTGNQNYKFPIEYQGNIIGELHYQDMLKVYKLYKVFLNVNSVKNSSTMFSRRVFEILASGTNIVSTYSKGIDNMFGNLVPFTSRHDETRMHLSILLNNPEHSQRLSLLGIRAVHSKHLYRHRLNTILDKIGIGSFSHYTPGVSIVTCLENCDQSINTLLDNYRSQTWANKELIIIVKNCNEAEQWQEMSAAYPDVSLYLVPENNSLGESLNLAVDKAKGDYVAVFNTDNYYATNFLMDLMNAFSYTDADIIGKACYYAYCEETQELILKNTVQENRFANDLADSSAVFNKRVFNRLRFPVSDIAYQEFLMQCLGKGLKYTQRINIILFTEQRLSMITNQRIFK